MKKLITIFFLLISVFGFSQQPIFAMGDNDSLFSFDLTNCTRHLIGITGHRFADIAFTPDGHLWGIWDQKLYRIDTVTATSTSVGSMGIFPVSLVDLSDTILLAEYNKNLYSINTNNASIHKIDTIGFSAAGDLTWYDDDLFMVTDFEHRIIKIVLNTTNTAILSVTPIQFSIPYCYGAVTASFIGKDNSLVGFNGSDLIKICHINGTYHSLCSNLNLGGTDGAASKRLVTQVPRPTSCTTTGVQDFEENNLFSIFPNPATNELNIEIYYIQKFKFNVYNTLGQLVKAGVLENNNTKINLNELTNGMYIIELSAKGIKERKCFIVENSCR